MKLPQLISILKSIAPLHLAESWDNVGLLINPLSRPTIQKVLLTIDLTEAVAQEAIEQGVQLILTYHPILFRPANRFNADSAYDRTLMQLIKNDIAVYSPHTALDAVYGGVNDWLAERVGTGSVDILHPHATEPNTGQGRRIKLDTPLTLPELADRIKTELHLPSVRVAQGTSSRKIKTVALCAGAGTEAFKGVRADCYLTGEMSHHNVLAATLNGTHVILCEHTHTERGFLPILAQKIQNTLEEPLEFILSARDADPLRIH